MELIPCRSTTIATVTLKTLRRSQCSTGFLSCTAKAKDMFLKGNNRKYFHNISLLQCYSNSNSSHQYSLPGIFTTSKESVQKSSLVQKHFSRIKYYGANSNVITRCIHSGPSSEEEPHKERWLPYIMLFPPVMWPRFVNTVRNWFFIHFVIKPYFDREFDLQEFDRGARQAVSYVSNKLSSGEFDDLEGLVEASALEEIKKSVSTFSLFQRDLIKVAVDDIFFSFPYQVGIIIPDQPTPSMADQHLEGQQPNQKQPQVRHVEITVVMHVLRGYTERQKADDRKSFVEFIQDRETRYNVMVCNYRFFRDFTEGRKDPSWILNMVNQWLPADIQRIQQRPT